MTHAFEDSVFTALNRNYENHRTPLHLNLDTALVAQDFESLPPPATLDDPLEFTGIGSRRERKSSHFPVIALNGLATVEFDGKKAILRRGGLESDETLGYTPDSELRDVLGDHEIDTEIFEEETPYAGKQVMAVVLRTKKRGTFEIFGGRGNDSLYIQQPEFHEDDHSTLVKELGNIGLITQSWQELTEKAGMGVVWAPWVEAPSIMLK
jgi:hypothetical protein